MDSILVPLPYPLEAADEPRAINRVTVLAATVRHKMNKEYSREWLESTLRRYLRGIDVADDKRLTLAIKAVEAADEGDELADQALREVGSELVERPTGRPGDGQILAYFQRAGRRAPNRRRRGRYAWYDHWGPNFGICLLILLACAEYGVQPTRNRESRRSGRYPSGISLVRAGLARNHIHLEEKTIQQKLWFGLPGELARQAVAERPLETWFSVSP